jgi:hypothetical protein
LACFANGIYVELAREEKHEENPNPVNSQIPNSQNSAQSTSKDKNLVGLYALSFTGLQLKFNARYNGTNFVNVRESLLFVFPLIL